MYLDAAFQDVVSSQSGIRTGGVSMIQLRDKQTGALLGSITEEELQFLIDQLEEESSEDRDYYLNRATLETLRNEGASRSLTDLLEKAMGDRDEAEVEWSRS
jgi:processive 1,2-diacylglycerol beta-glucosyltransferase